jgi:putative acetyltransferase
VRRRMMPYLSDLHTAEEDQRYFQQVLQKDVVWVALANEKIVGYCAFRELWLDHLYVHPDHHGNGVGTALLAKAKEQNTQLQLWVFQQNEQARKF